MKRLIFFFILIASLMLSACGSQNPQTKPDVSAASAQALAFFEPLISNALHALEGVRQDDLSNETADYDGETVELPDDLTDDELEYYEAAITYIVDSMPEGLSAYDQYRYLAFVVSLASEYDYELSDDGHNMTAYGAIAEHFSVCMGYTCAFQALCERANLWCETITGFASWNDGDHGWNLVKLNDGTYYIDVTWCDQYGWPGSDEWHRGFMLTETVLQTDHGVWDGGPATGTTIFEG